MIGIDILVTHIYIESAPKAPQCGPVVKYIQHPGHHNVVLFDLIHWHEL